MHRLFGTANPNPKPAPPTLDDASKALDGRTEDLDMKIKKCDAELLKCKELMKKQRGGSNEATKRRAMQILQQKKTYESQKMQLMNQQFNMNQVSFSISTAKDTVTTVAAMKSASKELKKAYKSIDIGEIESMHDQMSDLLDMSNDIQEALGEAYGTQEDIDESDLMAELEGLDEELLMEMEQQQFNVATGNLTSIETPNAPKSVPTASATTTSSQPVKTAASLQQ
jgi:charged multivesicular body protein 5